MHIKPDLAYATRDQGPLFLDAYLPDEGPTGTVIFAHGGGFRKGRRKGYPVDDIALRLIGQGWAVLSVSYRFNTSGMDFEPADRRRIRAARDRSTKVGLRLSRSLYGPAFMAAVVDLSDAVAWVRRDPENLGLAGKPVAVLGVSAGAIAGAGLAFPPAGWEARLSPPDGVIGLTGAIVQPWRLRAEAAPVLLFHGSADRIIPPGDLQLAERRAAATGADLTIVWTGRRGHNQQVAEVLDGADPQDRPWFDRVISHLSGLHSRQQGNM